MTFALWFLQNCKVLSKTHLHSFTAESSRNRDLRSCLLSGLSRQPITRARYLPLWGLVCPARKITWLWKWGRGMVRELVEEGWNGHFPFKIIYIYLLLLDQLIIKAAYSEFKKIQERKYLGISFLAAKSLWSDSQEQENEMTEQTFCCLRLQGLDSSLEFSSS